MLRGLVLEPTSSLSLLKYEFDELLSELSEVIDESEESLEDLEDNEFSRSIIGGLLQLVVGLIGLGCELSIFSKSEMSEVFLDRLDL